MIITIDNRAGFCPGVQRAIKKAEENLENSETFHSLGSLLHNELEMGRLEGKGLKIAHQYDLPELKGKKLLIRTHGEPPETYEEAARQGVELIDVTCGVVKRLQHKVRMAADEMREVDGTVVIFGKKDHPEVIGLLGHADGRGKLVTAEADLDTINLRNAVRLFAQTTMDIDRYEEIYELLLLKVKEFNAVPDLIKYNSICKYVSNRIPALKKFASGYEVIIFVSGSDSANGKKLFKVCSEVNESSYFLSEKDEPKPEWFLGVNSVGISGAASTPLWLMEDVANKIKQIN